MANEQPVPEEIARAARELGEALLANPAVQEYMRAKEAAAQDAKFTAMESELQERYLNLIRRQQNGEAISAHDINQYYKHRDAVVSHPLYTRRETAMRAVRAIFEQAGSALNSTLTFDFASFIE